MVTRKRVISCEKQAGGPHIVLIEVINDELLYCVSLTSLASLTLQANTVHRNTQDPDIEDHL